MRASSLSAIGLPIAHPSSIRYRCNLSAEGRRCETDDLFDEDIAALG